jgi:hypothetical protein
VRTKIIARSLDEAWERIAMESREDASIEFHSRRDSHGRYSKRGHTFFFTVVNKGEIDPEPILDKDEY